MILWTVLTAVLFLILLGFLAWALSQILRALAGIRTSLEKIAMGVRAIEQETAPLTTEIPGVAANLTEIGDGLVVVSRHLDSTGRNLPAAARALGLL